MRRLTSWRIYRPVPTADGAGGQTVTMQHVGIERGDMRQLVGRELIEAQMAGAEHTHSGYFRARADIARNDELRRGDETLFVLTVSPTFPETFGRLRVTARSIEAGG